MESTTDFILEKARDLIREKRELAATEAEAAIDGVIASQKATSRSLHAMLEDAMARALAYPHEDSFRQLLIIKVATEVARNIQMMDRKTWGLDDKQVKTSAIYEVLTDMEDKVERKAVRIEEKYSD